MTRSTKLAELIVNETSGVDHPAHLHEGWLVIKNAGTATDNQGEHVELNVTEESTVTEKAVEVAEPTVAHDEVAKQLADVRKELESIRVEKEALIAERELEKATEAAHAWAILPELSPKEFAPSLVSLRKALPEVAEAIEKVLDASARALSEAGVLKELGTSAGEEAGDAWGKIQSLANDLVAEGRAASFAKAVSLVAESNMDLYNQYLTEKGI